MRLDPERIRRIHNPASVLLLRDIRRDIRTRFLLIGTASGRRRDNFKHGADIPVFKHSPKDMFPVAHLIQERGMDSENQTARFPVIALFGNSGAIDFKLSEPPEGLFIHAGALDREDSRNAASAGIGLCFLHEVITVLRPDNPVLRFRSAGEIRSVKSSNPYCIDADLPCLVSGNGILPFRHLHGLRADFIDHR